MELNQLVLIHSTFKDENDIFINVTGTGYFITPNLVLTADHILPFPTPYSIRVRIEATGQWMVAKNIPVWRDRVLDAAVIRIESKIDHVKIEWQEKSFNENEQWNSTGYPEASKEVAEGVASYISKGLSGTLYFAGGGGQREVRKLDLTVNAPPSGIEKWGGISGAPIFVNNKLAGIIKNAPASFSERLEGIPSVEILKNSDFIAAIEESNYTIPATENWALILSAENAELENLMEPIEAALSESFGASYMRIHIRLIDVLANPGNLLNFVALMCKASIMIIDATNYQPGIMLLMGIRAVVRRAVTIAVTTFISKESEGKNFLNIPFNIQEIKLVSLDERFRPDNSFITSKDRLKKAIAEGAGQSKINPNYLDLPSYNAVRNPVIYNIPSIKEKVLVLCSFEKNYLNNFRFIHEKLANRVNTENIIRMVDINSPQLVGQSLHEHIRWSRQCIIDWTKWPSNVFYELGVRLAASNISPANLIEQKELISLEILAPEENSYHLQKKLLIKLFSLYVYDLKKRKFPVDINDYFDYTNGKESLIVSEVDLAKIYYDNIYNIAEKNFDWEQEKITIPPHISIKNQIERDLGKDEQARGENNILYSSNDGFKKAIQKRVSEYWLSAWFYLYNRYSPEELQANENKKKELISLGESVIAALEGMEEFKSISDKIFDVIDQLENIEL